MHTVECQEGLLLTNRKLAGGPPLPAAGRETVPSRLYLDTFYLGAWQLLSSSIDLSFWVHFLDDRSEPQHRFCFIKSPLIRFPADFLFRVALQVKCDMSFCTCTVIAYQL